MPNIQRMTITLPTDMAGAIKGAIDQGDYASSSEVVREALRDWKMKREIQLRKLKALKTEIDRGLADVTARRVANFNVERIVKRGRKASAKRPLSA